MLVFRRPTVVKAAQSNTLSAPSDAGLAGRLYIALQRTVALQTISVDVLSELGLRPEGPALADEGDVAKELVALPGRLEAHAWDGELENTLKNLIWLRRS